MEAFRKVEEKFTNQVIKKITNRIENAIVQQFYLLNEEETRWLSNSNLFKKKLEELRKKYDFLKIRISNDFYDENKIKTIYWWLKKEGE